MFLYQNCKIVALTENLVESISKFDCGHADLNDFFRNDSFKYSKELFGKTYCFVLNDNPSEIVCAFTVANDSIKQNQLPNSRKKILTASIPREKIMRSYPAVLIGRLGVSTNFKKQGIGTELLDFIKLWFIDENNKTGCRFIVVDAYNDECVLNFYKKNGFVFMFSTEEQEKNYLKVKTDYKLHTRFLYFDLVLIR